MSGLSSPCVINVLLAAGCLLPCDRGLLSKACHPRRDEDLPQACRSSRSLDRPAAGHPDSTFSQALPLAVGGSSFGVLSPRLLTVAQELTVKSLPHESAS
eukprot:764505-Hanusia_phi.AAC.3